MSEFWTRRRVNATGAALLGSTGLVGSMGLGGKAFAATPLRVGKAVAESIAFTPADIGVMHKIYQKAGLDLTITSFAGGPKMHQALTAGSLDIALGSGPDLLFLLRGEPAKAVAATVNAPAYFVVLARAGSGIATLADLKGKTVNVASLASITGWLGNKIWESQGWKRSDLKFTTSPPTSGLALLKTGQIDAMVTDGTFALKAQEHGAGKIIFNFGSMVKNLDTHMIFASDHLIASDPAAVKAFVKAWFETIVWMRANRAKTIVDLSKVLGLDHKVATKSYDLFMPMFLTDGRFSSKALATLAQSFVEMGSLPKAPTDLAKYTTEAFLPPTHA